MNAIVSTDNLSKRDKEGYRVKQVHLTVYEGDIYGFLGPNGAGKTTMLKLLLGLCKPTEGRVLVFGKELGEHRRFILSRTGSLIESPSYYGHLTGLENMRVMQRLRHVPERNIEEALRIVRLDKQKNKQVARYSLGMKQRLGIAMALLSFPKLLILDEPTNGLDPAGIGEIRELIQSLPKQYGMTVILSSHLLPEIEQVATSVGIINEGRLLFQGSMAALKRQSQSRIVMQTDDDQAALGLLAGGEWSISLDEGRLTFLHGNDDQIVRANRVLVQAGIGVKRIEERRKSLEDIFLELTSQAGGKERSL